MVRAAGLLEGEHDFTSFAAVDPERGRKDKDQDQDEDARASAPSNVRIIFHSAWELQADELIYTVKGSGFLHHMVRNLVGTFILLGKGTLGAHDLQRILQARDRSAAGATAPAGGLYLVDVEY